MPYFFIHLLVLLAAIPAFSQRQVKAVVADSLTKVVLPFATIRVDNQQQTFITGINGQFTIQLSPGNHSLYISYVSYHGKTVSTNSINNNDTIFLSPSSSALGEVVVKTQPNKVRRIINTVIRNKSMHNPEMYELYQCNIYYKMKLDLLPGRPDTSRTTRKSSRVRVNPRESKTPDSTRVRIIGGNNHLLFSETYSKRYYKRPQQLQDIVLASRFSGLKKTHFANLVTDILPFHVYTDYITLGGKNYINPIARGWQQRYDFYLADEINDGKDTTFILSFQPKKRAIFNGLKGLLYINSDGYAISHFVSSTPDTASMGEIRLEQVYERVLGKWFPAELNYDFIYGNPNVPGFTTHMNGHSIIDSVSFTRTKDFRFNRAYTARLHDSVDLRTEEDWARLRMDSITVKERNTYRVIDSLSESRKLEKLITSAGKIGMGRLPVSIFDIDLLRLFATNDYEGTRWGIGLYTNERLSNRYSIGGWMGYGTRDHVFKYGVSATIFADRNKDNWLKFYYDNDYQNAGNVRIHRDIDRTGFRNWILAGVDHKKELGVTARGQTGYLEVELNANKQKLDSRYENNFEFGGKIYTSLNIKEAGVGLRFAFGEKRIPVFGYYFPITTRYPVFYFRSAIGNVNSGDYKTKYYRLLAGMNYSKHSNRWGKDFIRFEAGIIQSFDGKPFSRSLLLAAKGFRTRGLNYYAWGGFLTMRPYDYYSDRYVSMLYRHDFDKTLWRTNFSKPYIGLAHNFIYGGIKNASKIANEGLSSPVSGYHESGFLLNQILQQKFFGTTIYVNAGVFYHWGKGGNWNDNGTYVIGISTGF